MDMRINFKNPVMPVDPYSQLAFVEILNIILARFGSLSGYFRWSFAGDCFTLWQRMDYNSMLCFNPGILEIHFGVLAARDNRRDTNMFN